MAHIIDLEKYKLKLEIKKEIKRQIPQEEVEFEIALTVAKYIYAYMEDTLDDPLDVITFHASTKELFRSDRTRFMAAILDIMVYWDIDLSEETFKLMDNEFELFPNVERICSFVEKRVV